MKLLFLFLFSLFLSSPYLNAADLKGKILVQGPVPPNEVMKFGNDAHCLDEGFIRNPVTLVSLKGELENAFIYLKEGVTQVDFEIPTEAVVFDQKKCMVEPRVKGIQVGQTLQFKNHDATLHNVQSLSKNQKGFNVALPISGEVVEKKFLREEIMVELKCDVHPWTRAFLGVLSHPYFSVTNANGDFEIKNIPSGKYLVEVWHERLGVIQNEIEIKETDENLNLAFITDLPTLQE